MLAYVYVVESPWFAKTGADGRAVIEGVPAGDYEVRTWHFAQVSAAAAQAVRLASDARVPVAFAVAQKAMFPRPAAK
jgi:hypothetical protein